MKLIKKKLLGVFACMLMLTMIPLTAGVPETADDSQPDDLQPESVFGWVWLRGLVFRCTHWGGINHALAIRLHYVEITPSERTAGIVTLNHVAFKDSIYAGRMYEVGFGMFTYVIGFFRGGLKIL